MLEAIGVGVSVIANFVAIPLVGYVVIRLAIRHEFAAMKRREREEQEEREQEQATGREADGGQPAG